ncbi:aminopeptidase [Hesseltinella vesiculosa]|uniref:Aminopeptidase n=1 Tax=Hesseltinella vesiculosa TaxID=101127 RepID=A0A1X2GT90_9FUNG|nr:aminopeptidase [Hesseltinella vesiculosa]
MSSSVERQVLPTNVKPTHYDLWLKPDLDAFVYDGRVQITLQGVEASKVITLNTNELKIHSATLNVGDASQAALDISYDTDKTRASLTFDQGVPVGAQAILDIKFEGILNNQMVGFYRSSYKDEEGNTKYLATTQFEPTDARRAFPCWDEPSLKATFDITLVAPKEMQALSNMNVIADEAYGEEGTLKQVRFATTPKMSTYLVAFVVGPFDYIEAMTSGEHNGHPIQVRVYAPPGTAEQGRLALNVAVKALEYFAKVFGEPYPLPKMDMVAISEFESGAMENWGLVTYRTIYLLFDEKNSSVQFKKSTAYVVCHELAHQWFGNLVTMQWWNELYLNEAFATWVGWLAVDHIYPEWDIWTSFVNDDMPRALKLDSLRSSHPIEVDVADASEIHQIFDAISYDKGASVIRMLSSWLGVDTFLAGVRRYIQRHKWENASSDNLWTALSEEAGLDVSKFMTLWTKHVGYPVLTVQEGESNIDITQSRYLSTGDVNAQDEKTTWWVPLHLKTSDGQVQPLVLTDDHQSFSLPADGLYKLNAEQTALYRVLYPPSAISRLAGEIRKPDHGLLSSTADRVGLISDVGSLMVSGEQSTASFLDLVQAFEHEQQYFVWSQLASHMASLVSTWYEQPKEVRDQLLKVRSNLFGPLADRLGWEVQATDDDLTNLLRTLALSNAGVSKHEATVAEAKRRFWAYLDGEHEAIHPNLRSCVFNIVLNEFEGDELTRAWDAVLAIYQDESLPTDQRLVALASLGAASDPVLVQRCLAMAMDEVQVRAQDVIYIFSTLGDNSKARDALWDYFVQNFDALHSKFGQNISMFSLIVRSAIRGYASLDRVTSIQQFFVGKDTKEYARALDQALESVQVRAKWVQRDADPVRQYLASA